MAKEIFEKVLLVDDDLLTNTLNERLIQKGGLGKEVVITTNAQQALEYLESHLEDPPDLIFLDVNMPGMNGFEFLEAFQTTYRHLMSSVIMMLTTSVNSDDLNKARKYEGVSEYINKPLSLNTVLQIKEKYLG